MLETHLITEDFINTWLEEIFAKNTRRKQIGRTSRQRIMAYQKTMPGRHGDLFLRGQKAIGFDKKIELLRSLGQIEKAKYSALKELNRVRNTCGHTWTLRSKIRKGVKRKKNKRHVLLYNGQSLFDLPVLAKFMTDYRDIILYIAYK